MPVITPGGAGGIKRRQTKKAKKALRKPIKKKPARPIKRKVR